MVANAFAMDSTRKLLVPIQEVVVQKALEVIPKAPLNARLATASVLLKYMMLSCCHCSFILVSPSFAALDLASGNVSDSGDLINALVSILGLVSDGDSEGELTLILLSALGTAVQKIFF